MGVGGLESFVLLVVIFSCRTSFRVFTWMFTDPAALELKSGNPVRKARPLHQEPQACATAAKPGNAALAARIIGQHEGA